MTGDEGHLLARQLVGDGHGLLRIAGIVLGDPDELLAHDAALGVDVLHGLLEAALHLFAE